MSLDGIADVINGRSLDLEVWAPMLTILAVGFQGSWNSSVLVTIVTVIVTVLRLDTPRGIHSFLTVRLFFSLTFLLLTAFSNPSCSTRPYSRMAHAPPLVCPSTRSLPIVSRVALINNSPVSSPYHLCLLMWLTKSWE